MNLSSVTSLNPKFFFCAGTQGNQIPSSKELYTSDYKTGEVFEFPHTEITGFKKHWPACIGGGSSSSPLLFREDVVHSIFDADLLGLRAQQVEIKSVNKKKQEDFSPPAYFWIKGKAKIETFVEVYKVPDEIWKTKRTMRDCEYIFQFSTGDKNDPRFDEIRKFYGQYPRRIIAKAEAWDGSDFFKLDVPQMFGEICCSIRFVELAYRNKWDGFSFCPMDSLGAREGVEITKATWPPVEWYPENQKALYQQKS
jgi:hypothetical protein